MGYPGRFRSAGRGAGKNFIVRGRTSMEKQLPAVRKLELIPIERRNFPKANRKRKKIQRKRKERDNAARGLVTVTVASMMLNAVMAVILYILQAGPI